LLERYTRLKNLTLLDPMPRSPDLAAQFVSSVLIIGKVFGFPITRFPDHRITRSKARFAPTPPLSLN
jgi:hypothetical protein